MSFHFQNMFNVSAIHRLRQAHNLTAAGDGGEAEVSSLLRAPGMNTERLWRETMHTRRGMIKEVGQAGRQAGRRADNIRARTCMANDSRIAGFIKRGAVRGRPEGNQRVPTAAMQKV